MSTIAPGRLFNVTDAASFVALSHQKWAIAIDELFRRVAIYQSFERDWVPIRSWSLLGILPIGFIGGWRWAKATSHRVLASATGDVAPQGEPSRAHPLGLGMDSAG